MGAAVGDTRSQAFALSRLGALVILSDPGAGDPMLTRAAELARTAGDQVALRDALGSLAISYFCQDDPGAMRSPLEETLTVATAQPLNMSSDIPIRRPRGGAVLNVRAAVRRQWAR